MPSPGPTRNDVVQGLRKSSKGQLKYCTEWNQDDVMKKISTPRLQLNVEQAVFKISSMRVALEAIEDDALISMKNQGEVEHQTVVLKDRIDAFERESSVQVFGENFERKMQSYEQELQSSMQKSNMRRIRERELFYADIKKRNERQLLQSKKRQKELTVEAYEHYKQHLKLCEESSLRIKNESQEQQDRFLRTRMQEQKERRLKLQFLEKQKEEESRVRFSQSLKYMEEIQKNHRKVLEDIGNFGHSELLANTNLPHILEEDRKNYSGASAIITSCLDEKLMTADDFSKLNFHHESNKKIQSRFHAALSSIQAHLDREQRKAEEVQHQLELQQKLAAEAAELERQKKAEHSNLDSSDSALPKKYKFCVSPSAYQNYVKLKDKKLEYEESSKELTKSTDRQMKKLAMDLSKAISVPVSSITDRSGSDLKSKLRVLTNILKGHSVNVGNKSVSTASYPQSQRFAVNFIAKKIVHQANEQVSANFTSAFSIALTVLGLWIESEDFGDLFMAHLHSLSTYTIPFYIPKAESQSDEEHQKLLGYTVGDDGSVEGQDKFLKRMSGLVRLYAAVIQSPMLPGTSRHPHGIEHGWAWLARMLNLDPYPDISATILYDFLDVAGHALMETYGRQFEKLLYAICHDYYPKIEEVSGIGQRAPLLRLKNFLEKCIKQKSVPYPEGRLDKGFWSTYHSGGVVGE